MSDESAAAVEVDTTPGQNAGTAKSWCRGRMEARRDVGRVAGTAEARHSCCFGSLLRYYSHPVGCVDAVGYLQSGMEKTTAKVELALLKAAIQLDYK